MILESDITPGLLTNPWYLKESYTLRRKSQNGQRYSNLNSSTKSASSTSAQTTRNFRYRKVLEEGGRQTINMTAVLNPCHKSHQAI